MRSLENAARLVIKLESEYGDKIESRIRPLIVVLQALGFPTSGSCEGHVDSNPYPWVLFVRHIKKPNEKTLDKTRKDTINDVRKLHRLLGEFYQNRNVPTDQELDLKYDLRNTPFNSYMLRPKGAEILEFTPQELLSKRAKTAILKRYQSEITSFVSFLQTKV